MSRESEVVGKELEPLVRFLINVADAAQRIRIDFDRIDGRQNHRVIGAHPGALVHLVGIC